jgi:DnaJ-class molecular chaperone
MNSLEHIGRVSNMIMLSEHVCRCCKGIGEMVVEPGGDGYAPLYDECSVCDGLGYETVERVVDYNGEHLFHVEVL